MSSIKSIIKKKIINEQLYNLAIEEDESYIAEGVVVHNCRSKLRYVTEIDVQEDKLEPSELPSMDSITAMAGKGFV